MVIAQKSKTRTVVIIFVSAAVLTAVFLTVFFIARSMRLENALKNLDVSDESTVIRAMKYGGKDADVVYRVAKACADGADYSYAAGLLLYSLQYLNPSDDGALSLLLECYSRLGADEIFLSQFNSVSFDISDFEPSSVFEGRNYGFSNGVYMTFCGGYAKAKISSVIPLSISACPSGVYVLDSSDKLLKYLSDTGLEIRAVSSVRMNEFIYCNEQIYFIDEQGIPHGSEQVLLGDKEFAAQLREENGTAVCSVYDVNYNKLRDITLK